MFGMLALYQNLDDRTISLQRMTKHPLGAHTEIGYPALIPEADLASRLIPEILMALDAYGEPYDEAKVRTFSDAEDAEFRGRHRHISIVRHEDGSIDVWPQRHIKGGFAGYREDKLCIAPVEVQERLYAAVLEALAKAQ